MIPYFFLFLVPAWLAVFRLRSYPLVVRSAAWYAIFMLFVLMIGLRHKVGGDWVTYQDNLNSISIMSFSEVVSGGDPAYQFLEWLFCKNELGIYWVNLVCAGIFSWGLLVFCRAQPRPWLALVVAIPYLVTVVAMGYTRQSVAIGLAMLGLVALSKRNTRHFLMIIVLAALFHKSAVLLLPLAIVAGTRRKIWTAIWVSLATWLVYVLLLQDSLAAIKSGYLDAHYNSEGAGIRVIMNAVPAMLFLWFRAKFIMSQAQRLFWTWMSLAAFGLIIMLALSPSSTAVDRIALYWIPLQLYVFSRLPDAIARSKGENKVLTYGVVAYSAAVLMVWLIFAQTAFAWLPYQFYPWVVGFH